MLAGGCCYEFCSGNRGSCSTTTCNVHHVLLRSLTSLLFCSLHCGGQLLLVVLTLKMFPATSVCCFLRCMSALLWSFRSIIQEEEENATKLVSVVRPRRRSIRDVPRIWRDKSTKKGTGWETHVGFYVAVPFCPSDLWNLTLQIWEVVPFLPLLSHR